MKRKLFLFLTLFIVGIGIITAQTQVRGTVVDEAGEPAIGATIQVKGTTQGTVTDANGNFNLSAPAGGTLVVSYVGYTTQEVPVSANVRITLVTESELLDEVMVVAYGTARKNTFTGSANVIKSDVIEKRQVSSIGNALSGVAPGIQVFNNTAQPGVDPVIRIRGIGSLNASSAPLWVIDDVPYTGLLNSINPEDIETMTILKDAASAALYGSRAANGVIIVTTKKGRRNQAPEINVKYTIGTSGRAIPEYKKLGAAQWAEMQWEALRNRRPGGSTVTANNQWATDNYVAQVGGMAYNPFLSLSNL